MSVHSLHKNVWGTTLVPDTPLSNKDIVTIKSDIVFTFIFYSYLVETKEDDNLPRVYLCKKRRY